MRASGVRVDWPLIGRSAELRLIAATLRADPPRGIVLTGPAGQGKTRLGYEALRVATTNGMNPLVAVGTRAGSTISLGALAHLLPAPQRRPDRVADLVARAESAIVAHGGADGVVLLLDDAHLVDDATATVVHQLALTGAATVVVTIRDDEPAPDPILALWKEGLAERLEIGPLTPSEVAAFASEVVEGALAPSAATELWRVSLGNPLFVRELLLGARDAGYLVATAQGWRFTSRLRSSPRLAELIEARLAQTSDAERRALELLSVAGRLDLDVLANLCPAEVLATLEAKRLIVVERTRYAPAVTLVHPVHGDVLRDTLGEIRTLAVNRALADAVEAMPSARREDLVRAAVWRLDGGGVVDAELMTEAARTAFVAGDAELAERLAMTARAAGAGVDAALVEARALVVLGDVERAVGLLAGAAASATTQEHDALIAIEHATALFFVLGRAAEAAAVLDASLDRVTDLDWRNELTGQHGEFDMLSGRADNAIERCAPLLADAVGRARVVAAGAAGPALAVVGRCLDAVAAGEEGARARAALGPQDALADPGLHTVTQVFGLCEAGRLTPAIELAIECHADSVARADSPRQAWSTLVLGRALLFQGTLRTADRWFADTDALFAELYLRGPRRWALAGRVLVAAMTGDVSGTESAFAALDAVPADEMLLMESEVDRARGWYFAMTRGVDAGIDEVMGAADRATRAGAHVLASGALHDVARLGRPSAALAPLAIAAAACQGELAHGRLAYTQALVDENARALDDAAARFEAMHAWLYAAEAAAQAAVMHRRESRAHAARAASRRSRLWQSRCEGAATPALTGGVAVAPLTARERDIARLAAAGSANRDIAVRLELSVRTVENHLQRAYEKLGVTSRSQLGTALASLPADPD